MLPFYVPAFTVLAKDIKSSLSPSPGPRINEPTNKPIILAYDEKRLECKQTSRFVAPKFPAVSFQTSLAASPRRFSSARHCSSPKPLHPYVISVVITFVCVDGNFLLRLKQGCKCSSGKCDGSLFFAAPSSENSIPLLSYRTVFSPSLRTEPQSGEDIPLMLRAV